MGWTDFTRKQSSFVCLSGSLVGVVTFSVCLSVPQLANSQDITTNLEPTVHYRMPDEWRPRLGFLLDSQTVASSGMNFQFCDGERASVALGELVPSNEKCDEFRSGTFAFADLANQATASGIPLYNESFEQVGMIRALTMDDNAGWGAVLMIAAGTSQGAIPADILAAAASDPQQMVGLTNDGFGLSYTANDNGEYEAVVTNWQNVAINPDFHSMN